MTTETEIIGQTRTTETVSSLGLVLNFAAVVIMAVALAGLGLGNGLAAACSAAVAVIAFTASLACFALDR
ncbi:hypothetical protein [Mycolicibacterium confluentis]|uniref:hypothetical protein n=1 Tax=Mycolicibacterium confluentis TaxID=28047 RepID=UPI001054A489|nr:hypothetical protein [Mycolicibacterium confluentis]MCV7320845.1 hypothetical protein [Mycolicibacterium confluentis]